jgi:hypothetical protein
MGRILKKQNLNPDLSKNFRLQLWCRLVRIGDVSVLPWLIGGGLLLGLSLWPGQGFSFGRDPFSFPPGVKKEAAGAKPEKGGIGESGLAEAMSFRLTTILISGRHRVAALNGVLVREGDELGGYRVEAIEEKHLVLMRGKEKMVIHIDSGGKYFFKKTGQDRRLSGSLQ